MTLKQKKNLISAGVTFISTLLLTILPVVTDPSWTYTGRAAIFAVLLAGVRAGIRALWEKFGPELHS